MTSKPRKPRAGGKYVVKATASSGLKLAFQAGRGKVCRVNKRGVVKFKAKGVCRVTVLQAGNADYLGATPVVQTMKVKKRRR